MQWCLVTWTSEITDTKSTTSILGLSTWHAEFSKSLERKKLYLTECCTIEFKAHSRVTTWYRGSTVRLEFIQIPVHLNKLSYFVIPSYIHMYINFQGNWVSGRNALRPSLCVQYEGYVGDKRPPHEQQERKPVWADIFNKRSISLHIFPYWIWVVVCM